MRRRTRRLALWLLLTVACMTLMALVPTPDPQRAASCPSLVQYLQLGPEPSQSQKAAMGIPGLAEAGAYYRCRTGPGPAWAATTATAGLLLLGAGIGCEMVVRPAIRQRRMRTKAA